jgi:gamma-glutamyltranspeptidase / glutathione hydrolase|tara:strand:- start:1365 stop:3110 length:1746 start_codon:yes stop_codon:yes gene_type:complete
MLPSSFKTLNISIVLSALIGLSACSQNANVNDALAETTLSAKKMSSTPSQAAIASAHPLATQAGMEILNQGGNAFDAAIAVAASLGVVEPYSAGIGGGGFWLIHDAKADKNIFIDAREKAPAAAHADLYLNEDGSVNRDAAVNGALAAGIPGQAAAFVHLAEHYGQLPLKKTLAAAIQQANEGFPVYEHYQKLMSYRLKAIKRYPESAKTFLDNEQNIPEIGYRIKQPDLAWTLQQLADKGFDGFYKGESARRLVAGVQAANGIWTLEDLASYNIIERQPIEMAYKGHKIVSAPPPSSGGIAIAAMLNMLSQYDLSALNNADKTHLIVETMRRAYKDRAEFLGDPDFVDVPTEELISLERAKTYTASIDMNKATSSLSLKGPKNIQEGFHTTHFSVIDKAGNRVSATLSINLPFGSAFTVPNTGVVLNNEMDDFSAKPGEPNAYGLVGNAANAIAPNKRPLSSMTPSFVESDDAVALIGTPGGSRIITMVMLGMLEHFDQQPVNDWVGRSRFHHQYLPDVIQHEPNTFSAAEVNALESKGHKLKNIGREYGNMQAILWDKKTGEVTAAADPRAFGESQVSE